MAPTTAVELKVPGKLSSSSSPSSSSYSSLLLSSSLSLRANTTHWYRWVRVSTCHEHVFFFFFLFFYRSIICVATQWVWTLDRFKQVCTGLETPSEYRVALTGFAKKLVRMRKIIENRPMRTAKQGLRRMKRELVRGERECVERRVESAW